MIFVVDASVALKWFIDEEGSPQAASLLNSANTLIAPDLIVPEVCTAAWKMVRRGVMLAKQRDATVSSLTSILDELVPTGEIAVRAINLATLLDHPACDCFYVALAEMRGANLITADRRLIQRIAGTPWSSVVSDLRDVTSR